MPVTFPVGVLPESRYLHEQVPDGTQSKHHQHCKNEPGIELGEERNYQVFREAEPVMLTERRLAFATARQAAIRMPG